MKRLKELVGFAYVLVGILFLLYAIYEIIVRNLTIDNMALLILGCILMVIGIFFKYKEEIEELEEEEMKVAGKKDKLSSKISSWRLNDLEYRLKRMEEEKEGSYSREDTKEEEEEEKKREEEEIEEIKKIQEENVKKEDDEKVKSEDIKDNTGNIEGLEKD